MRRDDNGVAHCGAGAELTTAQALALGQRVRLNALSADELALIPGVPRETAIAIQAARRASGGAFTSWSQVYKVRGVGPARLAAIQDFCLIDAPPQGK